MKKTEIVLFGNGKIADVLLYYLQNHSEYEVVAITVDREFIGNSSSWNDLPIIPFDQIKKEFPCKDYKMFIALGYQELNKLRESKFNEAKNKGYSLISYVHPDSGIPSDCKYGENCFIMQNCLIHPKVAIGNNVFVWSGAMIGHHSKIEDHCWLTSCSNLSSELCLGKNSFVGVNATVTEKVEIGKNCLLGANTLLTKCTENDQVFLEKPTDKFRLDSLQFLKLSKNF